MFPCTIIYHLLPSTHARLQAQHFDVVACWRIDVYKLYLHTDLHAVEAPPAVPLSGPPFIHGHRIAVCDLSKFMHMA